MIDGKRRVLSLGVTLVLVGLNLIALNWLLSGWSRARIDLTEDRLFSISSATRRIVSSLDEDLTIYGYFSRRTHPKLAPLVPQLTDLLEEYRTVSGGRITVEIIDPGEDEQVELEAANRYGVRSTPLRLSSKYETAIVNAFFSIVVKYGDQYVRYGFPDLIQVDATPDGDVDVRLRNPEYDLTRAIKKVVYGFRSTHELFERVDQPVKLTAIWTPDRLPELFSEVPAAVEAAAEQLSEAGGDRFSFEAIDPGDDEALQDQLYRQFGAQPMSLGFFGDETFYLYALLQVGDQLEQLLLTGDVSAASIRESVEDALRRRTRGFLKTVGIAAPDEDQIPPELRMQMQLPPPPPPEYEEIKRLLEQDYETTDVDLTREVPSEVDVLLVLEPKALTERAVWQLDQYLMRGGRVVLCGGSFDVDFGQEGLNLNKIDTGLDDWLEHLGVTIQPTLVLDDRNQPLPLPRARQTPFGMITTWEEAPYPYLVQVADDGLMNPAVTARLDSVGIYWGSPLTVDAERTGNLEVIPLLQSSPRSWTSDDLSQVSLVTYRVPPETEPHLLAVALSGRFESYFKGREVPSPPGARDDEEGRPPGPTEFVLEQSPDTRLVIVGNSEFLSDFVARALARIDGGFFIKNLRFAQNLIDWVSLDNDMLEIRSRGAVTRQLDRIEPGRQIAVEVVNYVVLVALVLGLAIYRFWRRRQVAPISAAPTVYEEAHS